MSLRRPRAPFRRPAHSGSRNESERAAVILDGTLPPGASQGLEDAVERAFAHWELRSAPTRADATAEATAAIASGSHLVIAAGGDGHVGAIINGLMDGARARSRAVALAVLPVGDRGAACRDLRVPRSLTEALWIAATGITLPTDVGLAQAAGPDGPAARAFLGTAAVTPAAGRGALLPLHLAWDGPQPGARCLPAPAALWVANGGWTPSERRLQLAANLQDGLVEAISLPAPRDIRASIQSLIFRYTAFFGNSSELIKSAVAFRATSDEPGAFQAALVGECLGHLPLEIHVAPRALPVRGGWIQTPLLAY